MSAYFQMGHDTQNLVGEVDLDEFTGIILSPINRTLSELHSDIQQFRLRKSYDIILDPQLYFPRTDRKCLREQPYFPSDIDTADLSSTAWWKEVVKKLADCGQFLNVNCIATPVIRPKVWEPDYYMMCSQISSMLRMELTAAKIRSLTSVMVNLSALSDENEVMNIASIVSKDRPEGYYIVFVSDIEPRRELSDANELLGAMQLIRELENTRGRVLVSHCSSDMILFKAAGASDCASGKFFNLRRFTKSRYEEPSAGGGQLPYWFEHSLIAFLREADILRLIKEGYGDLIATQHSNNYWSKEILKSFDEKTGEAWLRFSWRQFLSWFGKQENEMSAHRDENVLMNWLKSAEDNWLKLEDDNVLLEEPRNNGAWIRIWRQALRDFARKYSGV